MSNQENLVQKIRSQYVESQPTELEQLKALDAKVKHPANIFAAVCGSLGAIVMGTGMSLILTELGMLVGDYAMVIGIVVGVFGMVLVALAYPLYNRVLKKERRRIAPEILRLTDELMK